MMKHRLSLLHIEDDSLWQTVIATALRGVPGVAHVQAAPSARDGLAMAATLRPDIALLDLQVPDGDSIALARDLAQLPRPPRIVILSARRDSAVLQAASEPHIAGLLWKAGDVLRHLPAAIEAVASGGKFYPPAEREALRRFRADPNAFLKIFSPRELELLPQFGCGADDREIAAGLGVSVHTVRSHRQNVMRKLNLHNTARLIHWIIVNGFAAGASSASSA